MILVHHLNNSRSQRILWLLEELGLDYDIKKYERDKVSSLAPPELKKIHPLGKSPVVEDDGNILAETGAIVEYLIEKHGAGAMAPFPGTADYLKYKYWVHFAEGSATPQLMLKLFFGRIKKAKMPFFARPIANKIANRVLDGYVDPNIKDQLDFIEDELGRSEWFAGDNISGADIMMSYPMESAAARSGIGSRPRIAAFIERIHARPAYKRAVDRGGDHSIL